MEPDAIPLQSATSTVAAGKTRESTKLSSDFETFLTMLTAQAKYQDPLEPIDSAQYAAQLAQFSAVEQQVLSNELLQTMVDQFGSSRFTQLAGWVGMEVRNSAAVSFKGQPVTIYTNPDPSADQAVLVVQNESGAEVQRIPVSVLNNTFEWAGVSESGVPFEAGLYRITLESYEKGELTLTGAVESYSRIHEAKKNGAEMILVLDNTVEISADDVTAMRAPNPQSG